jgi:hypothetical protein
MNLENENNHIKIKNLEEEFRKKELKNREQI